MERQSSELRISYLIDLVWVSRWSWRRSAVGRMQMMMSWRGTLTSGS